MSTTGTIVVKSKLLTRDERFALRQNKPVTVLVAAEPSVERNELVANLTNSQDDIAVFVAGTVVETMATLGGIDVVVVADSLRRDEHSALEATYCLGFIRDRLRSLRPCVGFPVEAYRRFQDGRDICGYHVVVRHLQSECGYAIGGHPEPERHVIDLVLDALGLAKTT